MFIKIHHECKGGIEQTVLRIAVWHHEACRVMTNYDPKGQIFLSYPHTNDGFFFLLTTVFYFLESQGWLLCFISCVLAVSVLCSVGWSVIMSLYMSDYM